MSGEKRKSVVPRKKVNPGREKQRYSDAPRQTSGNANGKKRWVWCRKRFVITGRGRSAVGKGRKKRGRTPAVELQHG